MRKVYFLTLIIVALMAIMYSDNLINIMPNVDKGMQTYCTYYDYDAIPCGKFYISSNEDYRHISFGESISIDHFNLTQFLQYNDIDIIATEYVDGVPIYLMYAPKLHKYRINNGKKYNLQVAIRDGISKIGYPAIFDSF